MQLLSFLLTSLSLEVSSSQMLMSESFSSGRGLVKSNWWSKLARAPADESTFGRLVYRQAIFRSSSKLWGCCSLVESSTGAGIFLICELKFQISLVWRFFEVKSSLKFKIKIKKISWKKNLQYFRVPRPQDLQRRFLDPEKCPQQGSISSEHSNKSWTGPLRWEKQFQFADLRPRDGQG